jgi:hypothetical protein
MLGSRLIRRWRNRASGTWLPRARRTRAWALFIGLAFGCLAFWTAADFFHHDTGPGEQPDCPVCQLERATGCEAPQSAIVTTTAALVPVGQVEVPVSTAVREADTGTATGPRGPPSPA